ncbi:hypothetical protein LTR27_010949 [Elasticomyces elasticus]|nr:hypothetical protein LTR27_010949 [Elasticomyces elasticus]
MPFLSVNILIAAAGVTLGVLLRELCERFDLEFKGMYRRPAVVQIEYIRKPSLLLALPPELRNRIWEHTVSREPHVTIDKETWRQPPLLRTCKQIRQEAAPMYYGLNKFSIVVTDLDFKTDIRFCRSARSCVDFPPDTSYYSSGPVQPKWESLMEGAKAVHGGMIQGCQHNMAVTGVLAAAAGALKIARHLRGVPWEQVEEVLIVYKSAVVSSGTGWNWM